MATTAPKPPEDPKPAGSAATPEKSLGGPEDLILLDSDDRPVEALTREDAGLEDKQKPPFRLSHPKTQKLYEQAGTDDQGRTTYRPS